MAARTWASKREKSESMCLKVVNTRRSGRLEITAFRISGKIRESFFPRKLSHARRQMNRAASADEMPDAMKTPEPQEPEDDLVLVERVLAGDPRSFETIVRKHERRVFRVTLAVLGNAEDAEEAMQDTFVKAYRHIGQFRREARFTTWLTKIAVNEALQKRQARKNFVSLEEAGETEVKRLPHRSQQWHEDPEKLYGKQEMRRMVEDAIQSLPAIYRETFVLRDVEGLRAEEAAEILGLTLPAIKSRLLRARLLMREALAARLEETPTFSKRILRTAGRMREMIAMKLMKAVGQ
ncbi:MAG: sigma-70 family RNA polymerase sigma factor [Acidobacteriia bacterium]|nr:sigma-70 family RNA polymerase sigma factor [Terriglobia bacterium]